MDNALPRLIPAQSRTLMSFLPEPAELSVRYMPAPILRVFRAVAQSELRLCYQPCVDARTGEISHLEALLRWPQAPEGMNIQQLVNAMETNGLILPVGSWVIRQGCKDLAAMRRKGHRKVTLSVNVSHCQFADPGLMEVIEGALSSNRIPPNRFMIEMTESVFPNLPQAKDFVTRLRDIGVGTMIDDFGMGFSNFNLLKDVPATTIKLDRSYTAEVVHSRRAAALTETLVEMASKLDLEVIAEGVETDDQARWLSARGVGELQGWLFSPAVNLPSVMKLLGDQPWKGTR